MSKVVDFKIEQKTFHLNQRSLKGWLQQHQTVWNDETFESNEKMREVINQALDHYLKEK